MKRLNLISILTVMFISATAHAQAGFLFGLLLGQTISSGKTMTQVLQAQGIAGIPLRCLYVTSDRDYYDCRWTSMMAELGAPLTSVAENRISLCAGVWAKKSWSNNIIKESESHEKACDVNWHIELELSALKKINQDLAK